MTSPTSKAGLFEIALTLMSWICKMVRTSSKEHVLKSRKGATKKCSNAAASGATWIWYDSRLFPRYWFPIPESSSRLKFNWINRRRTILRIARGVALHISTTLIKSPPPISISTPLSVFTSDESKESFCFQRNAQLEPIEKWSGLRLWNHSLIQ